MIVSNRNNLQCAAASVCIASSFKHYYTPTTAFYIFETIFSPSNALLEWHIILCPVA